jgi:hypothetical protein
MCDWITLHVRIGNLAGVSMCMNICQGGIWDLGRYMAGWSGVLEPKRGLPPGTWEDTWPGGVGCLSPRGGSPLAPGKWGGVGCLQNGSFNTQLITCGRSIVSTEHKSGLAWILGMNTLHNQKTMMSSPSKWRFYPGRMLQNYHMERVYVLGLAASRRYHKTDQFA